MKKKVLLSSIATIALCLCLIAGSTFALFTSTSDVNISVTAGNVKMDAAVAITKVESVMPDDNGNIVDEFGGKYSYLHVDDTEDDGFVFKNGGTAVLSDTVVTLDKITPGDKVTLQITGANTSDVLIQYRYKLDYYVDQEVAAATGLEYSEDLMKGLLFTVTDTVNTAYNVSDVKYMETYTSPWTALEVGDDIAPVDIVIELPVTAGNIFQNKSTMIRVLVEAIQGNANVEDNQEPELTYYNTAATVENLADVLADPYLPVVEITESFADQITFGDISNKTINANGNNATIKFTGKLDNVVVNGIVDNGDAVPAIQLNGATGDITITNCVLVDDKSTPYGAVAGGTADLAITVDSCEISGSRPLYHSGAIKSLEVRNTTFKDSTSWAIQYNNEISENVIIDNCEFYNCTGLLKALYAVGNFTFTNNDLYDCDTKKSDRLKVNVYIDLQVYGEILVEGNTMYVDDVVVDADVDVADLLGVTKVN